MKQFISVAFLIQLVLFNFSCSDTGEEEPGTQVVINSMTPDSGAALTVVTLTGSGFSAVALENIVTLNNKPCPVSEASATELKISIPEEAGSGKIKVSVNNKTTETALFTFIEGPTGPLVSTFAGSTFGFTNGTGINAQFKFPSDVAFDAAGNIYVADQENHVIRKVTPAGVVTTFTGKGSGDFADGSSTEATFSSPVGLAFDGSGNLIVADYHNSKIRKITPNGTVSTIAGDTGGYADGTGSAANFSGPAGLAIDASGNIFVAEEGNHKIRKVTPAGVVTTFAGSGSGFADGTGTSAAFNLPTALAFDASGNLFVADFGNHMIRKITPAGVVSKYAGSMEGYTDGPVATALFKRPYGLAFDTDGNLFVSEFNKIRKITPAGIVSTVAGSNPGLADGPGSTALFSKPRGLAFDASGNLFVADQYNHRIRKVTLE